MFSFKIQGVVYKPFWPLDICVDRDVPPVAIWQNKQSAHNFAEPHKRIV